jgi:hypothetical protein
MAMDVFLSRLSYLTTQHELENIALSILDKKPNIPFTEETELSRCTVMEIEDGNGNIECHGLVKITPDSAAQWFIKHCHKEKLHNKKLAAHKYVIRDSSWKPPLDNDRRRSALKRKVKRKPAQLITDGTDKFQAGL